MIQYHRVQTAAGYLSYLLIFEEIHDDWNVSVLLLVEPGKHGGSPRVQFLHFGERHAVLVAGCYLLNVLHAGVKDRPSHNFRDVKMTKAQLTRFIVAPDIQLAVLIHSQSV